jgi:hypothetical protein
VKIILANLATICYIENWKGWHVGASWCLLPTYPGMGWERLGILEKELTVFASSAMLTVAVGQYRFF